MLHLQQQNHILNANRATEIDPWCVWLQTSPPDRLRDFPYKRAVNVDPDTFGKLGLAHFVLVIQTGDHCLFFIDKKQKKRKKVKLEIDVSSISDTSDSELLLSRSALFFARHPLINWFFYLNAKLCLNRSAVSTLCKATRKRMQHCWMLHIAPVCTPCCMLLPVVGSSFASICTPLPTRRQ